MPIYEAANSLIVHFGYGDIAVVHGRNIERLHENELCFVRQRTPHAIGAPVDAELAGKATDAVDCPVRLIFENVDSINVVIEELMKLREKVSVRRRTRGECEQ